MMFVGNERKGKVSFNLNLFNDLTRNLNGGDDQFMVLDSERWNKIFT